MPASQPYATIEGLSYIGHFITVEEEKLLLTAIDAGVWLHDLKRRVQHYGYKYDYKARRIDLNMKIGQLPNWLEGIAQRLKSEGFFQEAPDQVIVNEYQPGQGISAHIDCEPCFADTIVSLSLNSVAVMEFSKKGEKLPCLLVPRSIVALTKEARYHWMHCIPARKKDVFEGRVYHRQRRVSLTFRKVIL
ncbi:MAG: alpha-ketoglutarate-dependent dioxygenase AlkB [Saprospiraceae bacterium]